MRFFAPITKDDLRLKIIYKILDFFPHLTPPPTYVSWNLEECIDCGDDWLEPKYMMSVVTIKKDIKVEFDLENFDITDSDLKKILGFQTLENGLTFLGFRAGGDWQCPVFGIVYWDGKTLRGYIPTEGNPWNTETHTAYGDSECDDENSIERFGIPYERIDFDEAKILKDIMKRVKPKENAMNPKLQTLKTALNAIKNSPKESTTKEPAKKNPKKKTVIKSEEKTLFVSIPYTKRHLKFIQEIQTGLLFSATPVETKIDIINQQESVFRIYGNKKDYDFVGQLVEFIAKKKPTEEQLRQWMKNENKMGN
jgi:hypothetical protein